MRTRKPKNQSGWTILLALLSFLPKEAAAIDDLRLTVQNTNTILSWPSQGGQTFIVRWRPTFQTNTPWIVLTNTLPAATGTNRTTFGHIGAFTNSSLTAAGSGGGSGGGGTPGSPSALTSETGQSVENNFFKAPDFASKKPKKKLPDVPPLPWELDAVTPPIPDEKAKKNESPSDSTSAIAALTAMSRGAGMGFYQVVQTGVSIRGFPSGAKLSGTTNLMVEVGLATQEAVSLMLLVNGSPAWGAPMLVLPSSTPYVGFPVDTRSLSNGYYLFSVNTETPVPDPNGGAGTVSEVNSVPVSVIVTNGLYYPDWMSTFGEEGDALWLNAYLTVSNANWNANVYDAGSNYIGSLSGYTTDGKIDAVWNLVGANGVARTDSEFIIVLQAWQVVLTAPSGSPPFAATATAPRMVRTPPRRGYGAWVVAYQETFTLLSDGFLIPDSLNRFTAAAYRSNYAVLPFQAGAAETAYLLAKDSPDAEANWSALKTAIANTNSRNFFYLGHGAAELIGTASNPSRSYRSFQIARDLGLNPVSPNRHPYRFVFLDGCSTANGDMSAAFGIKQNENMTQADFLKAKERPKAFIGWTESKVLASGTALNKKHINFLNKFIELCEGNQKPLKQALDEAAEFVGPGLIGYSNLKIYGYPNLKFSEYNGPSAHP